ncbi:predicted protein [Nematostella vectensis]|uniref:Nucleolar protein 16 n=1 Tax=Nematostella vectensis TaxID=45351 RepID=A7RLJ9_NEMVE|nr:predicted protein [Nematostella vectensis]|eukprot:XP_001639680.1 predicted protein [Nematostella vectensis]
MGQKRKKKHKKIVKIMNSTLSKRWDHSKTLKQNFQELGLVSDVNVALPIQKKKKREDDNEKMEVEKSPTDVVQEFETLAANEVKKERRIAPGEAHFVWKLIQKHGEDYKAMSKDKDNYYQHTPKQLKRKCEAFLRSSQDFSEYLKDA